jgi:hypothetical protein
MRVAYADPPYIGQARKHYGNHPDYAGEIDHAELVARLVADYPDGWALSLSCKSLQEILALCPPDVRVMAWTKPLVPLLPGIRVQYGWEPVIMRGGRQDRPEPATPMVRDWVTASPEGFTFQPKPAGHVIGRKPPGFCFWLFECLGLRAGDTLDDLFPGSGAVTAAWSEYQAQMPLGHQPAKARLPRNLRRDAAAEPLTLIPREVPA